MRVVLVILLCGIALMAQNTQPPAKSGYPLPIPGRSIITTKYGIVAASQPMAAMSGIQILERGGNAVDAAIATNAVIGLMEPMNNGIGGDLFAIIYEAKTGKLYGMNSSGWAAQAETPELLASKGITKMPEHGVWSITVPGTVAGWAAMRDRFGTRPFSELLAPAIYYAQNGVPINQQTAMIWAQTAPTLKANPYAKQTFLIDGERTPKFGEIWKNPMLAQSLERIAANGRDGFYTGPTAQAIVATDHEFGGVMTLEDLADFKPEWVDPISTTYRGWTVYEIPPNTQGIAALMMLNLMEQFPMGEYGFHSAKALHTMIEAKKLAYADMLKYVGDPKFSKIPVEQLLSKERAAQRAKLIGERANCNLPADRIPGFSDAKGSDTIYMTVIDKDGNIVSLIQSNYDWFGSGIAAKGAGFALQNRGGLFTLEPNQPNTLAGHKRPLHTIIPSFMKKGDINIGFGIMGGWNQAQAHAQFVADIADYGMNIQQALEAGRFTKKDFAGCDVDIEDTVPEATRNELISMGHQVKVFPRRTSNFGFGQAVEDNHTGVHFGASDPRHDGEAIPQPGPVFEQKLALDNVNSAQPDAAALPPGMYRVGNGVTPPKVTFSPDPEYPEEARAAKIEGAVNLWVVVGSDGKVHDVRVREGIGHGLDEKAVAAVRNWRFNPATHEGRPVAVQINVQVNFRLYR
jgi:gamma-glutamyltranspeptidase/glutathione hydrolase